MLIGVCQHSDREGRNGAPFSLRVQDIRVKTKWVEMSIKCELDEIDEHKECERCKQNDRDPSQLSEFFFQTDWDQYDGKWHTIAPARSVPHSAKVLSSDE